MASSGRKKRQEAGGDGAGMGKVYIVLGIVAVVAVGLVAYSVGAGSTTAATAPVEVEGLDDDERLASLAEGVVKGNENAPVTILEFGDYQCPACQQFATIHEPRVISNFVETGDAKFVYYDFPLAQHPHAFLAARAARCAADQDRYWEYHEVLFGRQGEWSPSAAPPVDEFVGYAESLGMDTDDFRDCVESDRYADVVTANMRLGEKLGVSSTPTVIVSRGPGQVVNVSPNHNYERISAVVKELLGRADAGSDEQAGEGTGGS